MQLLWEGEEETTDSSMGLQQTGLETNAQDPCVLKQSLFPVSVGISTRNLFLQTRESYFSSFLITLPKDHTFLILSKKYLF